MKRRWTNATDPNPRQAVRAAEAATDHAWEDAGWAATRVTELEAVLAHQATTDNRVVDALTAERDGLRTQVEDVRGGKVLLTTVPLVTVALIVEQP